MLYTITLISSFITMVLSLWLGLYVVTRNPRSLIAWLTGFALWTLTRLFLDIILALNPPPMPSDGANWLQLFFPFWRAVILKEQGVTGWLRGWSLISAVMFWHHVTTLMRPDALNRWRWTRILVGYSIAVAWMIINITTPYFFASTVGDPLYVNTLKAGPVYPFFAFFLLLYTGMSVTNLARSVHSEQAAMPRKQLAILTIATIVGGVASPLTVAASEFGVSVPVLFLVILLGFYVILIGYGVARYSALVDGRTIWHDFLYNAAIVGLVAILYFIVTWVFVSAYNVPPVAFVLVVGLAVVTHALLDVARHWLDALFFRRDTRQLRNNLRQLTTLAGEHTDEGDNLTLALDSLCASVQATYGLIILFEENKLRVAATIRQHQLNLTLSPTDLLADDILHVEAGYFPEPLAEASLLIPLYAETTQLGAVILGHPKNGPRYSDADVDRLHYPSDWLADTIQNTRRETEFLAHIAELANKNQANAKPTTAFPSQISVKSVENALRNLANYAHLGEHPLAQTRLVQSQLSPAAVTHLDRGKVVYRVLEEAVTKLQPDEQQPPTPPSREWYAYLILHDAYFEDIRNRDTMARLFISEGTFSRTRRAAIRAVTKTLEEMEDAVT